MLGEKKLNNLINEAVDEKAIRQMADAFFKNAEKGRDAAVNALKKKYEKRNDKPDAMTDTHTAIVGFRNGFIIVYSKVNNAV